MLERYLSRSIPWGRVTTLLLPTRLTFTIFTNAIYTRTYAGDKGKVPPCYEVDWLKAMAGSIGQGWQLSTPALGEPSKRR